MQVAGNDVNLLPNGGKVLGCPMREIVDDSDRVSAGQERFGEVGSEKSSSTRDQTKGHWPPSAHVWLEPAHCSGRHRLVRGRHHPSFDFHRHGLTQEGHFNDQRIWFPGHENAAEPRKRPRDNVYRVPRTSSSDPTDDHFGVEYSMHAAKVEPEPLLIGHIEDAADKVRFEGRHTITLVARARTHSPETEVTESGSPYVFRQAWRFSGK